jgi:hypothetical protein
MSYFETFLLNLSELWVFVDRILSLLEQLTEAESNQL